MSLRKLVSAILAFAFVSTSFVPVSAVTVDSGVTTVPVIAPDVGTVANGANRDVIPVNLRVTAQGTEITYSSVSGVSALNFVNLAVSSNGQLSVSDTTANGTLSAVTKALVITPPSGTRFVKLISNGYSAATATLNGDLGSAAAGTLVNLTGVQNPAAAYPGSGDNGNAIIAAVTTQAGPASTFGTAIAAGSIVVYFVTTDGAGTTGVGGTIQLKLRGFGLAADPAATPTSSGSATATVQTLSGGTVLSAIAGAEGSTVNVGTYGSRAGKVEFVMVGDKTGNETSATVEPDSQNNSVLGNLLASGSTSVTIGPGNVTTTSSGATSLKVDTDALVLRAAERNDSTVSAFTFYETPFATSSFVTSTAVNENGGIATLNTALTDTTVFPNTANALMTVTFNAYKPGTTTASSATMTVNAVSVTLPGPRAFDGIRGQVASSRGGDDQAITGVAGNGGWLGAVMYNPSNGRAAVAESKLGIGVIYNGASSSTKLKIADAAALNFTAQDTGIGVATGLNVTTINSATHPTTATNGTWLKGIFPGVLVSAVNNGDSDLGIVSVATDNGTSVATFDNGNTFAAATFATAQPIYSPSEVTVRLVNSSGAAVGSNAWFFIVGNEDDADETAASGGFEIGATNSSSGQYENGAVVKITNGNQATKNSRNNAIAVARLNGASLQILPLTNKFDSFRDAIVIRPEISLTLDATSKTEGVDVVAVATGGNLPTSGTSKTVAKVLAAGAVSTNLKATLYPIGGSLTKLMLESSTDAGASRAEANLLTTITGASTSLDTIDDLKTTNTVIDTTVPPLFCGGTAGTATKGPNGVVFQPKARSIIVTENGADEFKNLNALGSNTVLRFTLPTGWDLNAYNASLAHSQILGVTYTDTFATAPTIRRIQPITKNGGTALANAFVDVTIPTPNTPAVSSTRMAIGLIFKPGALVAPVTVSDFNATVSAVNDGGTSSRTAAVADDVVLDTISTVALASGCSTFLSVAYCDDGLSTFQKSGAPTTSVVTDRVANGANLTSFGATPGAAARLIASAAPAVTLPDVCVTEGVADALSVGALADGVPTTYGTQATTVKSLHLASTFNGSTTTSSVGLAKTSSTTVRRSDHTIDVGSATTVGQNEVSFALTDNGRTSVDQPFETATEFRISGLTVAGGTAGTIPAAQDLLVWFEADDGTDDYYTVGTNTPQGFFYNANNGTSLVNVAGTDATEDTKGLALFNNGNLQDGSRSLTASNFSDSSTDANTNTLSVVTTANQTPKLSGAVANIFDNDSFTKLEDGVTEFSVSLASITGSTDKTVEVSGVANTLEPGSLLTIATSGTGPVDTVVVPVLPNGAFKAKVRASTSQTINVTQTPDSQLSDVPVQAVTLAVEDLNVDPELVSATATNIGLGSIPNKGKVAVVFEVVAKGKNSGSDFVPTAAQLTLGGQPVTAVSGSTTKFIGIADLTKAGGLTVKSSVGNTSEVELTLTTVAATGSKPTITRVSASGGFVFVKGTNLRNGTFGFILENGTFTSVTLRNRTKQDKQKQRRRSAAAATIPATATHAVYITAGGAAVKAI